MSTFASPAVSAATARQLRALRIRMTGLITLVVLVAVAVLTAVVFTITDDLVDRQIRAELEEAAGDIRARVLVFEDSFEPADEGPPPTNALLIDPEGDVAYGSVPVDQTAYADIAEITVSSAADAFSRDTVDGRTYETMTTAAFEDLGEALGVVVATYDATDDLADRDRRRRQVVGFAVVMVLGSAVAAWFVAGRSVRPAAAALAPESGFQPARPMDGPAREVAARRRTIRRVLATRRRPRRRWRRRRPPAPIFRRLKCRPANWRRRRRRQASSR